LGETCRDEYHFGYVNRISPEAPVPIFDLHSSETKFGMANNVKNNLESFGCKIEFLTNDSSLLIKKRFVDLKSKQQLLREDVTSNIDPLITLTNIDYDFVVISDYNRGLLNEKFIKNISKQLTCPVYIDTKKTSLNCFSSFKNCILKCNDNEFSLLKEVPKNINIIVTKGKNGATWNNIDFPAPSVELFDVTGAGDVFLSVFSVIYYVTKNMEESIQKSVFLASKSTKHLGIYKLTKEDILEICD
jgi:D-beta-D-heptose 7-phosphate kinase/D-beta-D-heptose 1-phosphate adenosyltransferase